MAEHIDALWAEYRRTHSDADRNRLVEFHLHYVVTWAKYIKRRIPEFIDLDDMIQDGSKGLMRAIRTFDPTRGTKFTSHAHRCVFGQIFDGLRSTGLFSRTTVEAFAKRGKPLRKDPSVFWRASDPHPEMDAADVRLTAGWMIDSLPVEQRRVMRMAYVRGLLQSAIATRLGVHYSTIFLWIKRSVALLKKRYGCSA